MYLHEKKSQPSVCWQSTWHCAGDVMALSRVTTPLYQPGAGQSAWSAIKATTGAYPHEPPPPSAIVILLD